MEKKVSIAIIDDDAALASNLKDILEAEGYSVEPAAPGDRVCHDYGPCYHGNRHRGSQAKTDNWLRRQAHRHGAPFDVHPAGDSPEVGGRSAADFRGQLPHHF